MTGGAEVMGFLAQEAARLREGQPSSHCGEHASLQYAPGLVGVPMAAQAFVPHSRLGCKGLGGDRWSWSRNHKLARLPQGLACMTWQPSREMPLDPFFLQSQSRSAYRAAE